MANRSHGSNAFDPVAKACSPFVLNKLQLKNRFIKTATYEGMTPGGKITDRLIAFHSRVAKGNIAMSTVAYGAVHENGRTHSDQLLIQDSVTKPLSDLTIEVRRNGAKTSLQLTHCGFFTRNTRTRSAPIAPNRIFNAYGALHGLAYSRKMTTSDMNQVVSAFARSSELAVKSEFDAIEVHMGHGYLLSQFLSPSINRRRDSYGGSTERRCRLPLEVIKAVRNTVGGDFPILVKLNLSDGFHGGLTIDESIQVAHLLYNEGVDALVLSGSYTSRTPFYLMRGRVPLLEMISVEKNILQKIAIGLFGPIIMKKYPFTENYFMPLAVQMRKAVNIPLVYQGGVVSSAGVVEVIGNGFELVGIGRALIHDPDFISKIQFDKSFLSACNHCNLCMVEMDRGGIRCVLNPEN